MPKTLIRIVAFLLVSCLIADPSAVALASPGVWRAVPISRVSAPLFQTQAIVPVAAVMVMLGMAMGQKDPAIFKNVRTFSAASRKEDDDTPNLNPTAAPGEGNPIQGHYEDGAVSFDFPTRPLTMNELNAYALLELIWSNYSRNRKRGVIISLDGESGGLKTTIGELLELAANQMPGGFHTILWDLDELMKDRAWRRVVMKRVAGKPLSHEEESLLSSAELASIRPGERFLDEESFWDNTTILKHLQGARAVLRDDAPADASYTFAINAYDQLTKRRIPKTYTVRKGDLLLVVGKYANREEFQEFYDQRGRFLDYHSENEKRFWVRDKTEDPEQKEINWLFYRRGNVRSWDAYHARTWNAIGCKISLTGDDPDEFVALAKWGLGTHSIKKPTPESGFGLIEIVAALAALVIGAPLISRGIDLLFAYGLAQLHIHFLHTIAGTDQTPQTDAGRGADHHRFYSWGPIFEVIMSFTAFQIQNWKVRVLQDLRMVWILWIKPIVIFVLQTGGGLGLAVLAIRGLIWASPKMLPLRISDIPISPPLTLYQKLEINGLPFLFGGMGIAAVVGVALAIKGVVDLLPEEKRDSPALALGWSAGILGIAASLWAFGPTASLQLAIMTVFVGMCVILLVALIAWNFSYEESYIPWVPSQSFTQTKPHPDGRRRQFQLASQSLLNVLLRFQRFRLLTGPPMVRQWAVLLQAIDRAHREKLTFGAEFHQEQPTEEFIARQADLARQAAYTPGPHGMVPTIGNKYLRELRILPGAWPVVLRLVNELQKIGMLVDQHPDELIQLPYHATVAGLEFPEEIAPWLLVSSVALGWPSWTSLAAIPWRVDPTDPSGELSYGQAYTYVGVTLDSYSGKETEQNQLNLFDGAMRRKTAVAHRTQVVGHLVTEPYRKDLRRKALLAITSRLAPSLAKSFQMDLLAWLRKDVRLSDPLVRSFERLALPAQRGGSAETTNPELGEWFTEFQRGLMRAGARQAFSADPARGEVGVSWPHVTLAAMDPEATIVWTAKDWLALAGELDEWRFAQAKTRRGLDPTIPLARLEKAQVAELLTSLQQESLSQAHDSLETLWDRFERQALDCIYPLKPLRFVVEFVADLSLPAAEVPWRVMATLKGFVTSGTLTPEERAQANSLLTKLAFTGSWRGFFQALGPVAPAPEKPSKKSPFDQREISMGVFWVNGGFSKLFYAAVELGGLVRWAWSRAISRQQASSLQLLRQAA